MSTLANAPITAVVITKNEGSGIERCLSAASFCEQVLVIDSHSTDETADIAKKMGAEVIPFAWNGEYPKKKQWGMSHPTVRNDWVLHLDADEVVTPELAMEIREAVGAGGADAPVAYDIPLAYFFMGKELKHGHRVLKRSLVHRQHVEFPEVGDLHAPGITEVEGHYQPRANGPAAQLRQRLRHDDPDPLRDWISRHNRYSDWEAHIRMDHLTRASIRTYKSRQGRIFDGVPFKPLVFFLYCYVVKLGFLDGRPGFDYAFGLCWYYWLIGAKVRELTSSTSQDRPGSRHG